VEEMTAEVNKARAALETAQRDLKSMASLNRVRTYKSRAAARD
jgi:hypothetical protein